jgi:glycosyltransferase involved in cell wall biosynthesis
MLAKGETPIVVVEELRGELLNAFPKGVKIYEIGRLQPLHRGILAVSRLNRIIRRHQIRVIFCHMFSIGRPLMRQKWHLRKEIDIILVEHSILSKRIISKRWRVRAIFQKIEIKYLYRKADLIVAVSKSIKNDLVRNFRISFNSIVVIYNPIAYNAYLSEYLQYDEVRIKIKSMEHPRFLFIGRFDEVKGADVCLKAFICFARSNVGSLIFFGSGQQEADMKDIVEKENLSSRVYFAGFVNGPGKYFDEVDALVSASYVEGFGIAICEAVVSNLPVIATDTDGAREILSYVGNPHLVEVGSITSLTKALEEFNGRSSYSEEDRMLLKRFTDPVRVLLDYERAIEMF